MLEFYRRYSLLPVCLSIESSTILNRPTVARIRMSVVIQFTGLTPLVIFTIIFCLSFVLMNEAYLYMDMNYFINIK